MELVGERNNCIIIAKYLAYMRKSGKGKCCSDEVYECQSFSQAYDWEK
jgi:hypothetical protein